MQRNKKHHTEEHKGVQDNVKSHGVAQNSNKHCTRHKDYFKGGKHSAKE